MLWKDSRGWAEVDRISVSRSDFKQVLLSDVDQSVHDLYNLPGLWIVYCLFYSLRSHASQLQKNWGPIGLWIFRI
jgi:hypothetical protein